MEFGLHLGCRREGDQPVDRFIVFEAGKQRYTGGTNMYLRGIWAIAVAFR